MPEDLRYPIGKFSFPTAVSAEERESYIARIASAPARLWHSVMGISDEIWDTPYREGGWTVRQVVHHVPDSHMNSYIRFKLALTEAEPTIKPYDEAAWALLSDSGNTPPDVSLTLLDCLHRRWVVLMRGMSEADWKRTFRHPELGPVSLDENLALYAWHGDHHIGHIDALRHRLGW